MAKEKNLFLPVRADEAEPVLDIWDVHNPRALINLVPPKVCEWANVHYQKKPYLFTKNEDELRTFLRNNNRSPNKTDNLLRVKFWIEYEACQSNQKVQMRQNYIHGGTISLDMFHVFLKNPFKVAWLFCPPTNYLTGMTEALNFGVAELRDILAMPNYDKKGNVLVHVVRAKISIFKILDERINGAATQRIEQKTYSISRSEHSIVRGLVTENVDERLNNRIKELERMERDALHLPPAQESVLVEQTNLGMSHPEVKGTDESTEGE